MAPSLVLTGITLDTAVLSGVPSSVMPYSVASISCVPAGRTGFCTSIALTMPTGVRPWTSSFCVSRSTVIYRFLPSHGNGTTVPDTMIKCGRRRFSAASLNSYSDSMLLDRPSYRTRIPDVEYLTTSGDMVPGGNRRTCVYMSAVICAGTV